MRARFVKHYGLVPLILAIIVLHTWIGAIPYLPKLAIVAALSISVVYQLKGRIQINIEWLVLLVYIPINILVTGPEPVFRPWERFAIFAVVLLSVGSVISNRRALQFRQRVFDSVLLLLVIISIASFFAYFLGVNYFTDRNTGDFYTDYVGSAGHFSGVTTHSMILGPIAAISSIYLFYLSFVEGKVKNYIPTVFCVGALLFSASRSAIVGAVVGILTILYYRSEKKSNFIKYLLIFVIIALVTFPLWQSALDGVISKQAARASEGGVFDSRSVKGICRIQEFLDNPICGIGFCSIDPRGQDNYDKITGQIEPGVSWLAVLSMLGIIGLILVINIVYKSFRRCLMNRNILVLSLVMFFLVHLFGEGYIFAGGNPLTLVLWMIIGQAYDLPNTKQNIIAYENLYIHS